MLHRKYSKKRVILATFAIIPLLSLAVFAGCNSVEKKQESTNTNKESSKNQLNDSATNALVNSTDSPNVLGSPTLNVKHSSGKTAFDVIHYSNGKTNLAIIHYKNGKTISGDVSTPEKERAFEQKYGVSVPPSTPPKIETKHFKIPTIVKDTAVRRFTPPKIVKDKESEKSEPRLSIKGDFKSGPGATDAEMKEYETLISEIKIANGKYKNEPDKLIKIHSIYIKMTAQQRDNASALPPPPPPPPKGDR